MNSYFYSFSSKSTIPAKYLFILNTLMWRLL